MHWAPRSVRYYLDGQLYHTLTPEEWSSAAIGASNPAAPFDQNFHMILNLAVGGGLPNAHGAGPISAADFPIRYQVDWVRVWGAAVPGK